MCCLCLKNYNCVLDWDDKICNLQHDMKNGRTLKKRICLYGTTSWEPCVFNINFSRQSGSDFSRQNSLTKKSIIQAINNIKNRFNTKRVKNTVVSTELKCPVLRDTETRKGQGGADCSQWAF